MSTSTTASPTPADAPGAERRHPVTVGVDGQPGGWAALQWALAEAATLEVPVRALHVHHIEPDWPEAVLVGAVPPADQDPVLLEAVERAATPSAASGRPLLTSSLVGVPALHLLHASLTSSALVIGAPRHGALGSAVLGSTAVSVAAHSHCPVVVMPSVPTGPVHTGGIVIGADGSAVSEGALRAGFERASRRRLPVTVVHAWYVQHDSLAYPTYSVGPATEHLAQQARAETDEVGAAWGRRFPDVTVDSRTVLGDPVQTLVAMSADAEMVVVGTHGRGEVSGLLFGSVSQGLLHRSQAPVMVVPADGARAHP